MEYLHIRLTHEEFPLESIQLYNIKEYVLVSHIGEKSGKFHYHLHGKTESSKEAIRGWFRRRYNSGGNSSFSVPKRKHNEFGYNYCFHPKSQPKLVQTDFSDEKIQEFKEGIIAHLQNQEDFNPTQKIVQIIYERVLAIQEQNNICNSDFEKLQVHILNELFKYCMENGKITYNRMIQKQYMLTILYKFNPDLAMQINYNWAKLSR